MSGSWYIIEIQRVVLLSNIKSIPSWVTKVYVHYVDLNGILSEEILSVPDALKQLTCKRPRLPFNNLTKVEKREFVRRLNESLKFGG